MSDQPILYAALLIQRLQDQILAVVRDATAPVSTGEIAARVLPPVRTRLHTRARLAVGQVDLCGLGYQVLRYDGRDPAGNNVYIVATPASPAVVYPHLRALEAAGQVCRRRGRAGDRQSYWSYASPDAAEHALAELEALFAGGGR